MEELTKEVIDMVYEQQKAFILALENDEEAKAEYVAMVLQTAYELGLMEDEGLN